MQICNDPIKNCLSKSLDQWHQASRVSHDVSFSLHVVFCVDLSIKMLSTHKCWKSEPEISTRRIFQSKFPPRAVHPAVQRVQEVRPRLGRVWWRIPLVYGYLSENAPGGSNCEFRPRNWKGALPRETLHYGESPCSELETLPTDFSGLVRLWWTFVQDLCALSWHSRDFR